MSKHPITRGDLVDGLYRVVDALNGAVAAVNDCDTTRWNDKEAVRRVYIAYDAMDLLCRQMAVRAKLSPVEDYVSLDAIGAGIKQRAEQSEYAEDRPDIVDKWETDSDYRRALRKVAG